MTDPTLRKAVLAHRASPEQLDELMQVTSPRAWIALAGCGLLIVAVLVWSLVGTVTDTVDAQGVLLRENGVTPIVAPFDGVITSFVAQSGDRIEKGEPLAVLSAPGKEATKVTSTFTCRLLSRSARESDAVKKGAPLLLVENLDKPLFARLYVPVNNGYQIAAKMSVQVSPVNVNQTEFGFLRGTVASAARFPITQREVAERLQNQDLAQTLTAGGPKLQILVSLVPNDKATSGYKWSTSTGPAMQLYSGTPCQGRVIVAEHRPIHLVFPSLGE